jgi:PAS domain S-box-containing protein
MGQSTNPDLFRLLFGQSADAMCLFDPGSGTFFDCNQAAVAMFGCQDKSQLLTHPPERFAPPFQPDGQPSAERAQQLLQTTAGDGRHRFEWLARKLDGEEFHVEVVATAIALADRPVHLMTVRNITDRKRAEESLRESQQILRSIADKLSEAIYRNSPREGLTFVNPAYLRMFGYESLADLRRVPRENLYAHAADRARLLHLLETEGGFTHQEIEYQRKDGSRFWGLSSSRAVHGPGQAIAYHVGTILDVTEQKRAADAIRELNQSLERRIAERTAELSASEARLRTLVDHAPEAIVVFQAETGQFVQCNENAINLFGMPRERLLRLGPLDVSPPLQPDGRSSLEASRKRIAQAMAGQTPAFEWMHRHSSGRTIPCEVRLVLLPGDGQKKLIRGSLIDNTERRRRERVQQATYRISEAVHAAEDLDDLYKHIHEIIQALMPARNLYIALFDPDNDLISFPYYVDEMSSRPEPMRPTTGLTGHVLRAGKPLLVSRRMNPRKREVPEGVIIEGISELPYVESGMPSAIWLGAPLTIHGRKLGVMAVQDYHDDAAYGEEEKQLLTFVAEQTALAIDRKRAEQALRESEGKFRALFEASSQGVMLHDEQKFLEVNPATVRILGFNSADEILGRHPAEIAAPVQPNGERADVMAQRHIVECLAQGSTRFEWLCRNTRGMDVPVEVLLTRIHWGGRQILQAVLHDITDRKKAEAELLRALAREKELSNLKSGFVSMISHEFRTPLGIIMSSAEILEAYFDRLDNVERAGHLESIRKNTRRMADLMEEVLLLGQAEVGRLEFNPAPMDVHAFFRRLIDELLAVTRHRCPIRFSVRAPLPSANADERLLRHIFTNLLSNAVKYSADESPVDLTVEPQGTDALFWVADRGIGIPAQDLEWLFNTFHRGRNVGHRRGTGLGLVIVKRCVEQHGGQIQIHSIESEGTTVTVQLPLFAAPNSYEKDPRHRRRTGDAP